MKIIDGEFPFFHEKGHVISFVGAGGKTSLMLAFAKEFTKNGAKVLVTTTTHIERPDRKVWAQTCDEVQKLWESGSYAVVGSACGEEKLQALQGNELERFMSMADIVLLEADGAKHMPCKVPATHEPVIPGACDIVIGVMGMDALGKPIEDVCFRKEETCRLLAAEPTDILSGEQMSEILASEKGTRKNVGGREYYAVLNKCDNEKRVLAGREILEGLRKRGIMKGVLTSLLETKGK